MKNVTIRIDENVARWARVRAAEEDTSLSRWIGELLAGRMAKEESYDQAMAEFLSVEPQPLKKPGARYPSRDDLHRRSER